MLSRNLLERIKAEYNFEEKDAMRIALDLISIVPEALIVNVVEWSEYRELSDIKLFGVSTNDVLKKWGSEDFIFAIMRLSKYAHDPEHSNYWLELRVL